jgi:hypothetical protein
VTALDNGAGEKAALDATAKKAKLSGFTSSLTPKGLASTPKTLGSRKRMAEAAKAETAAKKKA